MILYMYTAPGKGLTTPWGHNFDVNRMALSLCPFVASFRKKKLFEVWFYTHFLMILYKNTAPGQGQTIPWGQNFDVEQKHLVTSVICSIKWLSNIFPEEMYIFPYKSIRKHIWPCHKKGHCQPKVIIWTNFVRPKSPMLHIKPQGHWPFGSREWFLKGFYHIWVWRPHLQVMWPRPLNKLSFPWPNWRLHIKFAQQFRRRYLKMVDNDGRMEPAYTISSPNIYTCRASYLFISLDRQRPVCYYVILSKKHIGWMDGLGLCVLFNSISVISGWWKGEYEGLCTMKCHLGSAQRDLNLGPLDPNLGVLKRLFTRAVLTYKF